MRITIHSLSAIMLAALVAGQAWGVDAGPKLEIFLPGKTVPEEPHASDVVAWGWNGSGQTTVPSSVQTGVAAIAAGWEHTVALNQDGSVIAWGDNLYGQTNVPSSAQTGVVAIAAGTYHTVALKQDGSVIAWGANSVGQAGVPSSAQSGVVAIAAGADHTVALKQNGSVVAWGSNGYGQIAVPSKAQSGVVAIAAGNYHTVALKQNGSVIAWGDNGLGQTTVPSSAQSGVVAIAAGRYHTMALKQDGSIIAWGWSDGGQTTVPSSAQSGVVAIAAGRYHTVALKQDGSVIAWGYNGDGQTTVPNRAQSGVVAIAAGYAHTVALKQTPLIDFGPSLYGAAVNFTKIITLTNTGVGDTTISPSLDFGGASGFTLESASTISLAAGESAALTVRFTDSGSQPGTHRATLRIASNASNSPLHLIALTATVTEPEIALTTNGQSQATGTTSDYGTLLISRDATRTFTLRNDGNGALDLSAVSIDGLAAGDYALEGLSPGSIAPGQSQSFTVRFAPTVAGERRARLVVTSNDRDEGSFELNLLGRSTAMHLTNADASDVILPEQVYPQGTFDIGMVIERSFTLRNTGSTPLTGLRFVWEAAAPNGFSLSPALPSSLAAGESITFTLRFTPLLRGAMDLRVRLLADQPDDWPITLRFTGTVRAPKLVVLDAAGGALGSQGQGNRVIAWGSNYFGLTTVPSSAQTGVVAIAAGEYHTVALKQDGSVIAWGYNNRGQTTVPSSAKSGVVAIAAGYAHTVALKQDGSVIAWGWNDHGQTTVPSSALSGVVAIAAGNAHTVALKQDGSVIAWGYNGLRQTTVPSAAKSGVVAIAAGYHHTVALKQDRSVIAWGDNYDGQTNVPSSAQSGVVAIAAGITHTVALKQDGSVIAWGDNFSGQATVPSRARGGVVAIAAGGDHTVALKQDGSVIAWGDNFSGQATVPSRARGGVVAIAAGGDHTVALKSPELDLGPRLIGQFVISLISLASEGELPLTGLLTEITGPDADQFSLTGTLPGSIAPGASPVPLQVRFTPTRAGPMNATLRLHSNDPMTPVFELPLKGTGTFNLTATKPGVSGSSFTYGPLRLDRQTGLMLQKISFTNTTGVPLHGLRLILSSVASGVQVYSSSVGPVLGTYEVIYSNPIAATEAITFDLVYFDPKRRTAASIHPVISAEALLVPEPDSLVVPGTVVPLRSARATPQGPFLEWTSVPKATYVVEYSNDAGATWFSAVHRLSTTTTRMFWVDRGQPETKTKPVGVPNKPGGRLYRVKKL